MTWMKVTLSNADAHNQGKWKILQDSFEAVFMAAKAPRDASMFHANDYEQNWFYFSPGAVEIFATVLQAFAAVSCGKPPREELSLLVGDTRAWEMIDGK